MVTENISDSLVCEPLQKKDAPQGLLLSKAVGWNQTVEDWEMMIEKGRGFGLFTPEGQLVATAVVLPFGEKYGWISMVLVEHNWRRRGLATRLMNTCLDELKQNGKQAVLDATEAGEGVYSQIGFKSWARFTRLKLQQPLPGNSRGPAVPADNSIELCPMDDVLLQRVMEWSDREYGVPRSYILRYEFERWPESGFVALDGDGAICGYVLGRIGINAREIGPIVADEEPVAEALYRRVMDEADTPLYLDVAEQYPHFRDRRLGEGWEIERGFARMATGTANWEDRFNGIYASSGPDFG